MRFLTRLKPTNNENFTKNLMYLDNIKILFGIMFEQY